MRQRFTFVMVLAAAVALIAAPAAEAARDDIATRNTSCTADPSVPCFGSIVADATTTYTGGFNISVESEVWFNPTLAVTGMYTYFYRLFASDSSHVNVFMVGGLWLPLDPAENWGVVTSETSSGVWLDPEPGAVTYGAVLLTANLSDSPTTATGGLDIGETITFYAQSRRPPALQEAMAMATTGANSFGEAYGPTVIQQIPEPASVALLGSALFGILAAGARRRKTLVAA